MEAKRGDMVALVRTSHGYVIGQGVTTHAVVGLGTVTSITRDGVVKAVREVWSSNGDSTSRPLGMRESVLIIPAASIDVAAALDAYRGRRYPTAPDSTMVPPFDSIVSAREFLRPFLIERAA